jgi:threonine/homoserine/homoserine lactone efflux protein
LAVYANYRSFNGTLRKDTPAAPALAFATITKWGTMAMGEYGVYAGMLVVAYLMPGPDMLLVMQTGATRGRSAALAAAGGLAAARALHVGFAGLGLAALLRASPLAFEGIRLAGAAYLVWLGIAILRSSGTAVAVPDAAQSRLEAARRGLLTNLLNPKALLFASVLLPQFVHPERGAVAGQFALLGATLVAVGLAFDAVYACAGTGLGRWLERSRRARAAQRWGFASLLIGFGVQLALTA